MSGGWGEFNEAKEARQTKRSGQTSTKSRPPAQTQTGRRRRVVPDAIPEGYDRQIWLLARYFSELADDEEEQLDHGLPIIYQVLARRIYKDWPEPRPPKWYELALEMITEFWDREYRWGDRFADEDFAGVETFRMLQERCLNRLINRDLAADKEAK